MAGYDTMAGLAVVGLDEWNPLVYRDIDSIIRIKDYCIVPIPGKLIETKTIRYSFSLDFHACIQHQLTIPEKKDIFPDEYLLVYKGLWLKCHQIWWECLAWELSWNGRGQERLLVPMSVCVVRDCISALRQGKESLAHPNWPITYPQTA